MAVCSGSEPSLATLPEPSEVAGPMDPDGLPRFFLPFDTPRPGDAPDLLLPVPTSSNLTAVTHLQHEQPVPEQPAAHSPATAAQSAARGWEVLANKGSASKVGEGVPQVGRVAGKASMAGSSKAPQKKQHYAAALTQKGKEVVNRLTEAEAKLSARQAKYALAEGGNIHQR